MTSRKHSAWYWVAGAMLAAVLYVASIGPAQWYAYRLAYRGEWTPKHQSTFEVVYWPVMRACKHWQSTAKVLTWYLALWRPARS